MFADASLFIFLSIKSKVEFLYVNNDYSNT